MALRGTRAGPRHGSRRGDLPRSSRAVTRWGVKSAAAIEQLSPITRRRSRPLWPIYAAESLASVGTTLLMAGIFFYTKEKLGWGLPENLLLAAAQGVAYVAGSLAATRIAGRFGRRRGLIGIFAFLALVPLLPLAWRSPVWLVIALLMYTFVASLAWPALESLISSDADVHALSRRVGIYNLVWSGTNAVTFAAAGIIIARWSDGMFILPLAAHALSAVLLWRVRATEAMAASAACSASMASEPPHAAPEPQLLAQRTLALWLSRIALPATYVVVYSLMAMMPSLPVIRPLDTATQTIVGCVWMVARCAAFLYLGATIWWHTRPMVLLSAAAVMLVAFIGVAVRPSDVSGFSTQTIDLWAMIAWQIVLGMVMGIIYAGSLYFGMVLSEGSTEHGGYHEALIGLGSILGPGTAALTQWKWPNDLRAGVVAVSCVIGLSVLAATLATFRAKRRRA